MIYTAAQAMLNFERGVRTSSSLLRSPRRGRRRLQESSQILTTGVKGGVRRMGPWSVEGNLNEAHGVPAGSS